MLMNIIIIYYPIYSLLYVFSCCPYWGFHVFPPFPFSFTFFFPPFAPLLNGVPRFYRFTQVRTAQVINCLSFSQVWEPQCWLSQLFSGWLGEGEKKGGREEEEGRGVDVNEGSWGRQLYQAVTLSLTLHDAIFYTLISMLIILERERKKNDEPPHSPFLFPFT